MKNSNILSHFRSRSQAPGLLAVGVLALSQTLLSPAAFAATDESKAGQVTANKAKLNAIKTQSYQLPPTRAKNVILFVGDGMGVSTITAARILQGQQAGLTTTLDGGATSFISGEQNLLSFEQFPYSALSRTYSVNQQVSDSAPTITAMVTGVKTNDAMLSVTPDVIKDADITDAKKLTTIAEQCKNRGMAVGVVTTARVTHATPAGCYAHTSERNYECDTDSSSSRNAPAFTGPYKTAMPNTKDIAAQLLDWNGGTSMDVVLGGGRKYFMKNNQEDPEYPFMTGLRSATGRDLISEWKKLPNRAWSISAGTYNATPADNSRSAYVCR
jgi:alkaline phosphatase